MGGANQAHNSILKHMHFSVLSKLGTELIDDQICIEMQHTWFYHFPPFVAIYNCQRLNRCKNILFF